MFGVALDRDDVDGVRLVGVNVDRKAEIGRQIAADFVQESPALSLRMTSQCFCMKSTPGRDGCIAMR